MEPQYYCPSCETPLKVGDYIIFLAHTSHKKRGLILLHPEIGNYTSIKHPEFKFDAGEALEFFCPVCHASLASDFDDKLAHIILMEEGKTYDIYFSRIAGEKSTYKVDGDRVTSTGEHADRYTYFKMDNKFKPYIRL
jgi:hypothetical protein